MRMCRERGEATSFLKSHFSPFFSRGAKTLSRSGNGGAEDFWYVKSSKDSQIHETQNREFRHSANDGYVSATVSPRFAPKSEDMNAPLEGSRLR